MNRSTSLLSLQSRFDQLAELLRRPEHTERCRRPLADWASLSDRSVPFALLDQPVAQIIRDGFPAAAAHPGIGAKKLGGLIVLLQRVVASHDVVTVPAADPSLPVRSVFGPTAARLRYNARVHAPLREIDWDAWRHLLAQRKLIDLQVGRCIGRLRDLPSTVWEKPLRFYTNCTLRQLFSLPLHGNQRIAAVAEMCRRLADASDTVPSIAVGRPAVITKLSYRLDDLRRPELVRRRSVSEIRQLLLQQIEHDLGPQAADVFLRLTDSKSTAAKLSGWNRHYRRSIRSLCKVRCPELFLRLDELNKFTTKWPPSQRRLMQLLNEVLTS